MCSHSKDGIFTCEDNMLFLHVKISSFRAKARLVFLSKVLVQSDISLLLTDTSLINSGENYRHLTETNSRYYGVTETSSSPFPQYNFIVLTLVITDINQHLSTFRQDHFKYISSSLSLWLKKVRVPMFKMILLRKETTVLTFKYQS